jgi:hypothetical protein
VAGRVVSNKLHCLVPLQLIFWLPIIIQTHKLSLITEQIINPSSMNDSCGNKCTFNSEVSKGMQWKPEVYAALLWRHYKKQM